MSNPKRTLPLTPREQLLIDRERLSIFIREIKRYRTTWGMPPDKLAFRNAWMATQFQREFLSKKPTQLTQQRS